MNLAGYELSEEVIRGLELRYPNVKNVRDQIALAALWLARNPARKTKRPLRFVENWLKKSQPKLRAVPQKIPGWWTTDEGTLRQAAILGLSAKRGEEMRAFRERVMAAMKEAA
jgi:hypothetical protein